MGITVAEALAIGGLQRARLLAGELGLGNTIDHVCVLEQPPYHQWLRPNEFMLTTFFCLKDDLDGQMKSIDVLAEAGTPALAVHLGNFGYTIPSVLIERAESLGLPLIEVPSDVSYVEIMTPLMAAVLDRQNQLLRRSEEIHNRLITLVLEGRDLKSLVEVLASLLHRQVMLVDRAGEILQLSHDSGIHKPYLPNDLESDEVRTMLNSAFARSAAEKRSGEIDSLTLHTKLGQVRAFYLPIRLGGSQYALLAALDWGQPEFDQMDATALRQGVVATSVVVLKENAVRATQQKLSTDLFRDLISGDSSARPDLLERARGLGWDLTHKHVVALLSPGGEQLAATPGEVEDLQITGEHVYGVTGAVLRRASPNSIAILREGLVVLLPHWPGSFDPEGVLHETRALVEKIQSCCALESPFRWPAATLGRVYENYHELSKSYDEARRALSLRRYARLSEPIVEYDELVVYEILRQVARHPDDRDSLLGAVAPLLEYDLRKGSELVRTVEVFFDSGQRLDVAAQRLHLHVNTVKYRLRRAKDLLGFDPFGSNRQMITHLAVKLARIL